MSNSYKGVVLLDRDGVLIKDTAGKYITSVDQVEVLPNAPEAVGKLKANGFYVGIVTNQSAIGRGYCTEKDVLNINELISNHIRNACGWTYDYLTYCSHAPKDGCICRKPRIGQWVSHLRRGGHQLLEASKSCFYMIGDKPSDLLFGRKIGATPIWVNSGQGVLGEVLDAMDCVIAATGLFEAASYIVNDYLDGFK